MSTPPSQPDPGPPESANNTTTSGIRVISWGKKIPTNLPASQIAASSDPSPRVIASFPQSSPSVKSLRQPRPRLSRDTHTSTNSDSSSKNQESNNPATSTNPATSSSSVAPSDSSAPSGTGLSHRSWTETRLRPIPDAPAVRRNLVSAKSVELPTLPSGMTQTAVPLPNRIEGTYTDDFNILEVHELILKRFEHLRDGRIQELTEKLNQERNKLTSPQTVVDRKATQATINKLIQELDTLTYHRDSHDYLERATPLIETYRSLGTTTKVVSFKTEKRSSQNQVSLRSSSTSVPSLRSSSTNVPSPDRESRRKLRHATITQYLEIARHYIQVDVIRETGSANICPGCQMDLTDVIKDDETGIQTCPNPSCGYEKLNLLRAMISSENSKASTGGRNGYDDRDNFYKALMRYQGKQPNRLPNNLTTVLDGYFKSYGLPTSEEVRKMPLNDRGTRGNTTRELMYRALFETGNASYYEDVNLICHIVWLWSLPDVSHLEDQIMDDYDKTQKVYECIWKNRKSNLNTQYRLFKHLQLRGHNCSIEDFKMVKTREILEYHDSIWEIMTTGARLQFIRTI